MNTNNDDPDNEVMCYCSGNRRKQIRELFLQGNDMDAISRRTGALTGCGGCEWDIEVYLEELAEQRDEQAK